MTSFLESLALAEEIGLKKPVFESHNYLSGIFERQGNYNKALEHLKHSYKLELDYLKEESELKAKNITTQLEIEQVQKEAEIERLKNVELAKALEEVKQLNVSLKELNDEKNEFMAIAVHDLKNPILNILSAAKLIKNRITDPNGETMEFTDNIIYQTDRMFGLIKKLLDHNAIEQGNIKLNNSEFILSDLCEELIKNFKEQAESKNISVTYENNSPGLKTYTDKVLLYEILQNLLSNAIKFSPNNKAISIKTAVKENKVLIEVKDEGPGFTEEDKKKIFTKFAKLSAKPTGDEHSTGLGLSIVKKLTDFINGTISLESASGHGTKFILSIPVQSLNE
jgi:signal transduction histidine kinase